MSGQLIGTEVQTEGAGGIEITPQFGGIRFDNFLQVLKFAEAMASSDICVPYHCRNNVPVCVAIITRSLWWRQEPFFIAEHSYVVEQKRKVGGDYVLVKTLAFDATVIHAVLESRAPLTGRLRCEFEGEGRDRVCTVFGTFRGESQPHILRSQPFHRLHPGYTTTKDGHKFVKGSPLWDKDPDQQQFYHTVRNWGRRWCPDVLGGIYDKDELVSASEEDEPQRERLYDRLPGREKQVLSADVVDGELASASEAPTKRGRGRPKGGGKTVKRAEDAPRNEIDEGVGNKSSVAPTIGYANHVKAWSDEATSEDDLRSRWADEAKMRDDEGVSREERQRIIEEILNPRLTELKVVRGDK